MLLHAYQQKPIANYNTDCISCTLPNNDSDLIFFTDFWKVVLHPDQSGLGSCLITARRHVGKLSELTPEEFSEFFQVITILEPTLEHTFGATLINLSCDRNWAYRTENPDPPFKNGKSNPHVHWHLTTRYSTSKEFEGILFEDPSFGEPITWRSVKLGQDLKNKIITKIQNELGIVYDR
ncbi:MAG: HIT family protein [Candidatus Magasanikbacteria bacterium]|nr:HIT family protein [Candidatus Magasanikbacteria bacterium]